MRFKSDGGTFPYFYFFIESLVTKGLPLVPGLKQNKKNSIRSDLNRILDITTDRNNVVVATIPCK